MKAVESLPDGYSEIFKVNLQKDKSTALKVNLAAFAVMLILGVAMNFHVPITTLYDFSKGIFVYIARLVTMLAAAIAYIFLHELTHGITMKIFGCKKVNYGFTGLYAYAGSSCFFDKKSYITVALAPVVLWFFVISVINMLVPEDWFWVVYFVQLSNLSGAAGDIYVSAKLSKMPSDILVTDSGVEMFVFSKSGTAD